MSQHRRRHSRQQRVEEESTRPQHGRSSAVRTSSSSRHTQQIIRPALVSVAGATSARCFSRRVGDLRRYCGRGRLRYSGHNQLRDVLQALVLSVLAIPVRRANLPRTSAKEVESAVAALRLALWRCPCAPTLRSPHTRNPAPTAPSSTFPCRKQWALANHVVALPLLLRGRRLRLRAPRRRPVRPHALPYRLITTDAALIARPEPLADAHPCTALCPLPCDLAWQLARPSLDRAPCALFALPYPTPCAPLSSSLFAPHSRRHASPPRTPGYQGRELTLTSG